MYLNNMETYLKLRKLLLQILFKKILNFSFEREAQYIRLFQDIFKNVRERKQGKLSLRHENNHVD